LMLGVLSPSEEAILDKVSRRNWGANLARLSRCPKYNQWWRRHGKDPW
jgi:hypothetical protein